MQGRMENESEGKMSSRKNLDTISQLAERIMADLRRDFWIRETGTGQQVAQLHDRYMMMIMMMIIMMMVVVIIIIMTMMNMMIMMVIIIIVVVVVIIIIIIRRTLMHFITNSFVVEYQNSSLV
jgi:type IV secretory pathway VirB6-like protein